MQQFIKKVCRTADVQKAELLSYLSCITPVFTLEKTEYNLWARTVGLKQFPLKEYLENTENYQHIVVKI